MNSNVVLTQVLLLNPSQTINVNKATTISGIQLVLQLNYDGIKKKYVQFAQVYTKTFDELITFLVDW